MSSDSSEALTEYLPGRIWLKHYPIRFAGCRFDARMSVIRLRDGRLLVHSPCPIETVTKAEIEALGSVAVIIAPGNYHWLNIGSARDAFAGAEIHICPGVDKKDPTLLDAKILGDEPNPIWAADFDQVLVRGSRFICEVAFYHRDSKTLILVDLIENFGDDTKNVGGWLKFWWKVVFRMWNRPKPAPEYQIGWKNRAEAKSCLEKILTWGFERIIISHGDLIEKDAQQIARTAWQSVLKSKESKPPAKQIEGHYNAQKRTLLKDFDHTLALMRDALVDRYGTDTAHRMEDRVRSEFETLIPEIPFIPGGRARMLNVFLLVTAQEVAVYRALSELGKSPEEIWGLCHMALRLRTEEIPQWKKWLLRKFMFSRFVKMIMARRAKRYQVSQFGDFEIEYLSGDDENFDLGINYRRCGNYRFAMDHGAEEFAPYICMSDIALSEGMGWGLTRTQTLADGCDHCDFRMKEGASTRITSKTPEVQRAIESISAKERKQDQIPRRN
jgi:hypothetical protein